MELRYDQSHYLPSTSLPSTSSSYVSFGKDGGCKMCGGGYCRGCGLTPLMVMPSSCSQGGPGREMVMVEEQQMTQSRGGEKVEGQVENDLAPWEESCLAKFSEFLGFPTEGFKGEILELMSRINARRQKGKGKRGVVSTKFDRELKKLEWNVMDSGRKKNGATGKGVRAAHSGV